MHEYGRINGPDCVSETLNTLKFVPFARLGFINFKLDVLADCIGTSTDYDHHSSDKDARMLIPS